MNIDISWNIGVYIFFSIEQPFYYSSIGVYINTTGIGRYINIQKKKKLSKIPLMNDTIFIEKYGLLKEKSQVYHVLKVLIFYLVEFVICAWYYV